MILPTLDIAITQHTSNRATCTRCHNYDIYRRPSPPPDHLSGPDSCSITCSMSQGHGPHGTHSVGQELAEPSLGRIFSRTRKKPLWYIGTWYVQPKLLKFEIRPNHASKNTRCRAWLDQF